MTLAAGTVLVTGATGFIGGRLVEQLMLAGGTHVRVLVRDLSRAPRLLRSPWRSCRAASPIRTL
jgi:uncharacterized protein YbjT (DUF2867 family)